MGNLVWRVYPVMAAAFLLLDALWLGVIARSFYRDRLGELMRPDPGWWIAAVFYLLFVIGLLFFTVRPATSAGNAILLGALFGFFTYATYELTNLATLRGWPVSIVVVDLLWGSTICAVVAWLGYLVRQRFAG